MEPIGKIQLGKNGVTENFIKCLESLFKNHKDVKIHVLKSATRNKEEIKKNSEEIAKKLGKNYSARVIGFTIIIKRWRREVKGR